MPTEPTGLEHVTPVKITSTSATERGAFRKCRRQWFLTVVHRLDPQQPNVHFFLGNIYHKGLEAYYRALKDGSTGYDAEITALDAYQEAYDEHMAKVEEQLGFLMQFSGVSDPFRDMGAMGMEMLQNYLERERTEPLFDEVIAVEFRVNVAIRSEKGRKIGVLSVQADAVGMKDGELKVADHKTAGQAIPSAHLDLDDQLTAEVFAWWQATGNFPDKAVYNVSYKKVPKPPRELKSGALSKDKGQLTTGALYRAEIARLGLRTADYVEHLAWLDERERTGEDPLFRREEVFRTPGQMAAFERDLRFEWLDMRRVASDPQQAYPSPNSMSCGSCSVRTVCTAIQDDSDVETIIKAGFVVSDPRR